MRAIASELAASGHLAASGKPYAATAVMRMIERREATSCGLDAGASPIFPDESVHDRNCERYGNPNKADEGAVKGGAATRAGFGVSGDRGAARWA